jgi:hypothetical protein
MATTIVSTRPSGGNAQPAATQLTALSSTNTTGFYVVTGPNTGTTLTFVGTANQIDVANGTGLTGNPTFSLAPDAILPGTGAITLPIGTSAEYPATPVDGMIRYNSTTQLFEFHQNGTWVNLSTGVAGVSQIVAGTNVTISPVGGTGIVTVNATGGGGSGTVTSVSLSSTDLNVSGSPITSSGTITADLVVQGGLVPGMYANADVTVNSKGVITAISSGGASTIRLYTENYVAAVANTVTGQNAFAIGEDNTASGQATQALGVSNEATALGATAIGNSASATHPGQLAHAGGKFGVAGDAQGSDFIYRGTTLTQFPIEIFLDGSSARLTLVDNAAITFEALVVARRTDVVGDYASFRCEGLIKRDTGAASTAIIGTVNKNIIARTNNNLNVNFIADIVNGSLKVLIQGASGQTYRWVVRLITAEEIA